MSLINDALKRASQVDPAKAPVMEILEPAPTPPPSRLPLIVLPLVFVASLGLGGWFLLRGWQAARLAHRHEAEMKVAARQVAEPVVATPPAVEAQPVPATPATPPPQPVTVTEPVAPPAPAVPTFPKLRLQGVFLRVAKPSVVVNNRTLWVGDSIDEASVIAITGNSVIMEWKGERRELKLP